MTSNETSGQPGGVVAGFDGSDRATQAVLWAAGEAESRDRPLLIARAEPVPVPTVGHAWGPVAAPGWGTNPALWDQAPLFADERVRQHNEQELETMARRCREHAPRLTVSVTVVDGPASIALASVVARIEAELLVVGASGLSALPRMLLGSTAADLVHGADRPVVVVRDSPAEHDAPVVVGVDGTDASRNAIEFALDFAARHGRSLHVIHARSDQPLDVLAAVGLWDRDTTDADRPDRTGEVEHLLGGRQRRHPEVPIDLEVVDDRPAHALLSRSERARLLVVGNRGRGAVRRALLGSVSHAALYHASCPVAIVPDSP